MVANGKSIVGKVAVWRSPVILPTDLEVWTAKPWPKGSGPIPNNTIICSTLGLGLTALGGGDYDGDDVSITTNHALIEGSLEV